MGALIQAAAILPRQAGRSSGLAVRDGYRIRLAATPEDRLAAFRLRFLVFNLELNEGLESAYADGCDRDDFDDACDHLIVEHAPTRRVIATYRLQTGRMAAAHRGYYSAREFDFAPYESLRDEMVELGRAAIHRDHRSFDVLVRLWRGVGAYARANGARYLIGCSSLTSQSPAEGLAAFAGLGQFLAPHEWRTRPNPGFACTTANSARPCGAVRIPKLLRAYLSIGAVICGEPAIDREFKTIDFLTLLDLDALSAVARARFLR